MGIESALHIAAYLLMFLCPDVGVNTIIISIIVFVLIVVLAQNLSEVYLESQNEWLVEEPDDMSSGASFAAAEIDKRISKLDREQ